MKCLIRMAAALAVFAIGFAAPVHAKVVARVDLSQQRMRVYVDGVHRYTWPVSTARRGYITPTGRFRPQSMHRFHRSSKYNNSPMPHSIFFHRGYAIHGSYETRKLGRRASHGCIRLHPANARELYRLMKAHPHSRIVVHR